LLRVDVHGTLARHFLLPGLPAFLARYPDIRLHIAEAHQPLDMIRDGFDCILRAGDLADSSLISKRIATLRRGTFASPAYLERFGVPKTPDDLEGHRMVGLLSPDTSEIAPLVFCTDGQPRGAAPTRKPPSLIAWMGRGRHRRPGPTVALLEVRQRQLLAHLTLARCAASIPPRRRETVVRRLRRLPLDRDWRSGA
jgi:DNA-binding transcriptional LysR family regulator